MNKEINDKARSIKLFEYFVEFLKIFGQENYGESADVNWFAVFNYCQSYGLFDFNPDLEEIIYSKNNEEFRDKCFAFLEKNIIEGYPIWRLYTMSSWLFNQLEKELNEKEIAKDKQYFNKTVRCYRCKHYIEHTSVIDRKTKYSYPAKNTDGNIDEKYLTPNYQLLHFRDCGKRRDLVIEAKNALIAKGKYISMHFEDYYTYKYRRFNSGTGWYRDNKNWKLNAWSLRRCPYFEEDPNMTYDVFIKKYGEMLRITEDYDDQ